MLSDQGTRALKIPIRKLEGVLREILRRELDEVPPSISARAVVLAMDIAIVAATANARTVLIMKVPLDLPPGG